MKEEQQSIIEILQGNLKRIRKQKKLTQAEAGAKAGMQQAQYSRLETASNYDPGITVVERAAQALDIPLIDLFRDPNIENLPLEQLLQRIIDLAPSEREPLVKVIEAYLKEYESERDLSDPEVAKRLKELQAIRERKG